MTQLGSTTATSATEPVANGARRAGQPPQRVILDPRDDPRWEALTERSPSASLFCSAPWIRAVARGYDLTPSAQVLLDEAAQPRAGLAYVLLDDAAGRRAVSLPFSDYCDPLLAEDEDWDALVKPLLALGAPVTVKALHARAPRDDARFEEKDEVFWHQTAVAASEEAQWEQLRGSARRNIRKASGNGVDISCGDTIEELRAFYDLHREVRRRKYHLLVQPWPFFEALHEEFAPRGQITVLLARREDRVIGGVVALAMGDTLYYKFNASALDELEARPNDLLAWEALALARRLGKSRFDWGISDTDQPGLVRYKQKFATEEGRVSIRRQVPEGYVQPAADELRSTLGELTGLLTRDDVPEEVRRRASELLYRYFA